METIACVAGGLSAREGKIRPRYEFCRATNFAFAHQQDRLSCAPGPVGNILLFCLFIVFVSLCVPVPACRF